MTELRSSQEYEVPKEKAKTLGGRFRNSFRLNLDTLSSRNRNKQVDTAMDAADDYYSNREFEAVNYKEREKVSKARYTVLTNPLRAITQSDSFQHNAASLDQNIEKFKGNVREKLGNSKEDDQKEEFKEHKPHEIRRRAKEIYFDTSKLKDIYSENKLTSESIDDKDKAFMIDELPRLFDLLEGKNPNLKLEEQTDQDGEAHREVVLNELILALPKLSDKLQRKLLGVVGQINKGEYSNRFLKSLAEESYPINNYSRWDNIDKEARKKFLESLSPANIDNVGVITRLLAKEEDPEVKTILLKFLHKFSNENTDISTETVFKSGELSKLITYQREEAVRLLSSTKFEGGVSNLVGEAIFNLANSENMVDSYKFGSLVYKSSEFVEVTKYDTSSMNALLKHLEGKLGKKTPGHERVMAIKLASSTFDAVSKHLERILKSTNIDNKQLNESITLLTRIRKKFMEPAKKDAELKWIKFNLNYIIKPAINKELNPINKKSRIPRIQKGRLKRLLEDNR